MHALSYKLISMHTHGNTRITKPWQSLCNLCHQAFNRTRIVHSLSETRVLIFHSGAVVFSVLNEIHPETVRMLCNKKKLFLCILYAEFMNKWWSKREPIPLLSFRYWFNQRSPTCTHSLREQLSVNLLTDPQVKTSKCSQHFTLSLSISVTEIRSSA